MFQMKVLNIWMKRVFPPLFPHRRWTIYWSPGPAPLGLITLPRSSGNWAAGPASVSRRRRRLASRQTTQPPVCLSVCLSVCLYMHRQMHKWGLTVLYTVRINRSGDWQESQRRWERRAENVPGRLVSASAERGGSLWNSKSEEST